MDEHIPIATNPPAIKRNMIPENSNIPPQPKPLRTKKSKIFISVLIVLLITSVAFIGYTQYSKSEIQEEIFQGGMQFGYNLAIGQIVQLAIECKQVPLTIDGQTINLFAVECLRPQNEDALQKGDEQ